MRISGNSKACLTCYNRESTRHTCLNRSTFQMWTNPFTLSAANSDSRLLNANARTFWAALHLRMTNGLMEEYDGISVLGGSSSGTRHNATFVSREHVAKYWSSNHTISNIQSSWPFCEFKTRVKTTVRIGSNTSRLYLPLRYRLDPELVTYKFLLR